MGVSTLELFMFIIKGTLYPQKLTKTHISDWNINKALDQISEKEYNDKLKNLCEKKIDPSEKPSPKLKDKIIRSLTYKGWEIDKVIRLVNQLIR